MDSSRALSVLLVVLFSSISATPVEVQNANDTQSSLGQVIFVNVLYRHGDRTPVDPYPTDPYRDSKYWSTGWGQLTTLGMRQHYELGKWLRSRYRSLLSDDYSRDDILIQSSDVDRTLMSAMSNLAGMYPPSASHQFDGSLPWQPIPIHTLPEQLDNTVAMKKRCPTYEDKLAKLKKYGQLKEIEKKYHELFLYLSRNTGREVLEIKTAEYIHNTLFIEELNNLTLPEWTKSVYPEPLRSVSKISFTVQTYTPDLARLKAGPLVGQIVESFRSKANKKMVPDRKLHMYSAHDTTVANLLNTLKVFDPSCPPYTATVLLELRQKEDAFYVAIYYKNSTGEPFLLTIPGCSEMCPLKKFEALVRPVIPDDWDKECQFQPAVPAQDLNKMTLGALILCFVALVCLILTTCLQRRSSRETYFRIQ